VQDPARQEHIVCAVAPGEGLLTAQSRSPDRLVTAARGLRPAVEAACGTGAEWLWLLDGLVVPRPGALAALLDGVARADGLEQPSVLAAVVVDRHGGVDPRHPVWYRPNQIDLAMMAASRRLLPVRAAAGSVLVRADAAVAEPPPPRALDPHGVLEWTARILRSGTGYLVPESEGEAVAGARDPAADPRTAGRLLLGGAFVRLDRLRYGYELAERAIARSGRG
jgi:hypothetical protein